jgi:Tfp pilus assembly protein PilF
MDTCERAALWMDQAEPGALGPPEMRQHLIECPACRRRAALRDEAVALFRQATDGPAVPMPSLAAVRGAAHPASRDRRRVVGITGALAAAALLVAVWAAWPRVSGTDNGRNESRPAESPTLAGQIIEASEGEVAIADPRIASVTLAAGTRLAVDAWSAEVTRLRLERGRIETDVRHRATGQSFEIRTDLAVVRVVGTRFVVSCVPGVETVVTGIEGVVQVDRADGRAVGRVTPGLTLRVSAPEDAGRDGGAATARVAALSIQERVAPLDRATPAIAPAPGSRVPTPPARAVAAERRAGTPGTSPDRPTVEDAMAVALALLSRGADREAVDTLTAALPTAGPQRPRLLALLGDAHRVAGRLNEARTAYEEALSADDGSVGEGVQVDLAALLQADLHRPEAAAAAWRRYLEAHPRGRYVSRALWELSRIAEDAGRTEEALEACRRLVLESPGSEEAPRAFVKVGRALIDRGDLPAAEAWFQDRGQDPAPSIAEAAVVGLMRTRLAQGRGDDVRSLAATHALRFPTGERRGEVQALLDAVGHPDRPR